MKLNYLKLSAFLLGALYIVGMIYVLYGCSANYHFTKFLKKGGTIDTTDHIVTVNKMVKVNGKDSIIFIEMPLKCPEVQIPPTRQEIRYKYRIKRDSIETIRYITKWKTKEVIKVAKTENKSNWWVWFIVGFIASFLVRQLWIAIMKKL